MDIDTAVEIEFFSNSMASLADHARGVALVHHHEGIIFLGKLANLVHRGDIAVHAEYAVGDDDAEPLGLGLFKTALQIGHICISIAVAHGLAKSYAVDDGCVVESIGDYGVFCR